MYKAEVIYRRSSPNCEAVKGATTSSCWGRSGTFRQQRSKRYLIGARNVRPPRPYTNQTAPDMPCAVHEAQRRFASAAGLHDGLVIYINAVHTPAL